MPRPHFDAAVIGALRTRVIEHNEVVGRESPAATRLEALKKIYGRAWRGPGSEEGAMMAVDNHLALAKAEFDENKVNRDADGRFAPKGAPINVGQRRQFMDVRTSAQDQRLRDQNVGYRASQTAIIPETRFETSLPYIAQALTLAAAATAGTKSGVNFGRKIQRGAGALGGGAGWLAGRTVGGLAAAGANAARRVSRRDITPAQAAAIAERMGDWGEAFGRKLGSGYAYLQVTLPEQLALRVAQASTRDVPYPNTLMGRYRRMRDTIKGRAGAAAIGMGAAAVSPMGLALFPLTGSVGNGSALNAAGHLGGALGHVIDAWMPRRVDKLDAPEIEAVLAKVASGADIDELVKALPAADIAAIGRAVRGPAARAAHEATALFRRPVRLPYGRGMQAAGATLAGAAGAGTAYAGSRLFDAAVEGATGRRGNPYRDEEGRFTSREKAVMTIGGLAAAGAALYAMRRGNVARFAGRVKDLRASVDGIADKVAAKVRKEVSTYETDLKVRVGKAQKAAQSFFETARNPYNYAKMQLDDAAKSAWTQARKDTPSIDAYLKVAASNNDKAATDLWNRLQRMVDVPDAEIRKTIGNKTVAADMIRVKADLQEKYAKGVAAIERNAGGAVKSAEELAAEVDSAKNALVALQHERSVLIGDAATKRSGLSEDLDELISRAKEQKLSKPDITNEFEAFRTKLDDVKVQLPRLKELGVSELQSILSRVNARSSMIANTLMPAAQRRVSTAQMAQNLNTSANAGLDSLRTHFGAGGSMPNPFGGKAIEFAPPKSVFHAEEVQEGGKSTWKFSGEKFDDILNNAGVPEAEERIANLQRIAREVARGQVSADALALEAEGPGILPAFARPAMRAAERILGGTVTEARADIRRALRAARNDFGGDIRTVGAYLFGGDVGGKTVPSVIGRLQGYADWAKEHTRLLIGSGVGLAAATASADIILDKLGVRDAVKNVTGADLKVYQRLEDDGRGNKRAVWGIVDAKTGKFVYGDAVDMETNSRTPIEPGESAKQVEERLFRRGGGNNNQGGGGGARVGWSDEERKRLGQAKSDQDRSQLIEHAGAKGDDIPGGGFRFLGGNWSDNDSVKRAHGAAKGKINGFIQNGGKSAAEKLQALTDGELTRFLTPKDIAEAVGDIAKGALRDAIASGNGSAALDLYLGWAKDNTQAGGQALARGAIAIGKATSISREKYMGVARDAHALNPGGGGGGGGGGNNGGGGGNGWAVPLRSRAAAPAAPGAPAVRPAPAPSAPKADDPPWSRHPNAIKIADEFYEQNKEQMIEAQRILRGVSAATSSNARQVINSQTDLLYSLYLQQTGNDHAKARELTRKALQGMSYAEIAKSDTPAGVAKLVKYFDETKVSRSPRGSDRGGEFASRGGGQVAAGSAQSVQGVRPPQSRPADDRSFFEPVRFGGTVGGYAGMQAAWDIANKYLPGASTRTGKIGRLAGKLGVGLVGGGLGTAAGESVGRGVYGLVGRRAPGSYEPPERPAGEEASRAIGGLAASAAAGLVPGGYGLKLAASVLAGMSGEELGGAIYRGISGPYGRQVAQSVHRWLS